jgi:hypothetical protein
VSTDDQTCQHGTITCTFPDQWSCADCGVALPDPHGCQHRRIDNNTRLCRGCGERMIGQHPPVVETVLSAPNKAACTNPECSGDVNDPYCENPAGLYVPDTSRERVVPIVTHYSYICERCRYLGDVFTLDEKPIWSCGRDHRGDSVPIREAESV